MLLVNHAFHIYTVAKQTMEQAGFNLRKWHSNSQELLTMIQAKCQHKDENNSCSQQPIPQVSSTFVAIDDTGQFKLLGIVWDSNHDTFNPSELAEQVDKLPASRRSLLRITASIFDPLGVLSPFVMRLKILFQLMCCEGLEWDQPLVGEFLKHWLQN